MLLSVLMYIIITIYGRVKKSVMPLFIFWIIFLLDLELNFIGKLWPGYLDDLLNIDNIYFDQMVNRIYPTELQLNRANSSDTEAPFLDLNLCISNGTVSTKIYDKRDDFDFDIVNFPFLDGDVPRRTSNGVYISQLIRFARASSNLNDFNYRNKALTAKLFRQGYRYF